MTELEFYDWLEDRDLGPLEDVRHFVLDHALENSADVALEDDPWYVAKATVEAYLDDPSWAAEVFAPYRRQHAERMSDT